MWENLKQGKLGEIETTVSIDPKSLQNVGISIALAGFFILLAWYVFKTRL
jgi:hypothetical protein